MDELLDNLIANNSMDVALYQYLKQLRDNRTLILNDGICEEIVERIYMPLRDFERDDSQTPATLILHSQGGSVANGMFFADYLEHYSKPLNILVLGYACSMATVFLAAAAKNPNITTYCYKNSYALIHDGYVALAASESGTAQDIMAFNHAMDEKIRDIIVNNTKITEEEYKTAARKQWFLFSEDMKKYGLVDKIIGEDD